jgi:hypothetical protein
MVTTQQRAVLQTVDCHGLITVPAAHVLHFQGREENAAVKCLRRLHQAGTLTAYPYLGRRTYYSKRPLGTQGLMRRLSLLGLCALFETRRVLLSDEELREEQIDVEILGFVDYCREGNTLLAALVDYGASPAAIINKIVRYRCATRDATVHCRLLAERRFCFVVLTGMPEKKDRLEHLVKRDRRLPGYPVRVHIIPELRLLWEKRRA